MRLFCLLSFFLAVPHLPAAVFHLDAASTAELPDGSAERPWKTVVQMQEALAEQDDAGGGAVVRIAPGEYGDFIEGVMPGETAEFAIQRRPLPRNEWLRFEARDPARPPVFRFVQVYNNRNARLHFDGIAFHSRPPHRQSKLVHLRFAAMIRFTGCEFSAEDDESALPSAVYAVEQVEDLTFERCRVRNLGSGITAGARNLVVRNCELRDLSGSALMIGVNAANVLLEGNYIHRQVPRIVRLYLTGPVVGPVARGERVTQDDTGAEGVVYRVLQDRIEVTPHNTARILFAKGRPVRRADGGEALGPLTAVAPSDLSHGSGLSLRCSNLVARNNVIHNYGSTAAIYLYPNSSVPRHTYRNITIENNLVFDPLTRHIVLNQPGDNILVRNNTVPHGDIQFYPAEDRDLSGVTVENNICTGILSMTAKALPTLRASNNILHWVMSREPRQTHRAFAAFPDMLFLPEDDAGRRAFAEFFVDFNARDFRLRDGSRATGFGRPGSAPATDLAGKPHRDPPDAGGLALGSPPPRLTPPLGPSARQDRSVAFTAPDLTNDSP